MCDWRLPKKVLLVQVPQGAAKFQAVKLFSFFKNYIFFLTYHQGRSHAFESKGAQSPKAILGPFCIKKSSRLLCVSNRAVVTYGARGAWDPHFFGHTVVKTDLGPPTFSG